MISTKTAAPVKQWQRMMNKTCHFCLAEKDIYGYHCYLAICIECTDIDVSVRDIASGKSGRLFFHGVEFGKDNWEDHWEVVYRRIKQGTERRYIKGLNFDSVPIEDIVIGQVPGVFVESLWCPYSMYETGDWWFEHPKSSSIAKTKGNTNHSCQCGQMLFIGIFGVTCDKCGTFNTKD